MDKLQRLLDQRRRLLAAEQQIPSDTNLQSSDERQYLRWLCQRAFVEMAIDKQKKVAHREHTK